VISIIRLVFLSNSPDFTFQAVTITSWSISELSRGIVCVSLPTLRPLAAKCFTAREKPDVVLGSGVDLQIWPGADDQLKEVNSRYKCLRCGRGGE
jgi:hypothetical protein